MLLLTLHLVWEVKVLQSTSYEMWTVSGFPSGKSDGKNNRFLPPIKERQNRFHLINFHYELGGEGGN